MAKYIPSAKHDCAFLLKKEAANYLRVSPSTFRRLEKAGALPDPVIIGAGNTRIVRYRRADLDGLLAQNFVSNDNAPAASLFESVEWD